MKTHAVFLSWDCSWILVRCHSHKNIDVDDEIYLSLMRNLRKQKPHEHEQIYSSTCNSCAEVNFVILPMPHVI